MTATRSSSSLTCIAVTMAIVVVVVIASGCARRPDAAACDAMLDRYLDMTEDDDPALTGMTGDPRKELRAQRLEERKRSAAYAEAEAHCVARTSASEHRCAMKAPSPNEWEACFEPE